MDHLKKRNYLLIAIGIIFWLCIGILFTFINFIPSTYDVLYNKENPKVKNFEKFFSYINTDNKIEKKENIMNTKKVNFKQLSY